jgi:glutaredoxin
VYYDVHENPAQLKEMMKYSKGARQVPIIVVGGKVTIGHGGT